MIKKLLFFLFITFLYGRLAYAQTELEHTPLVWHTDISSALIQAKKEEKNLLVMVGENNCRWCVKMKAETLSKKCVSERLKKYVLVSVKRSDKNAIQHLDGFDGVIPSFFFIEANETPIDAIVGYFKADDFIRYIDEVEEE